MQQFLDRRQPSSRLRPQVREIPLQRRRGTAGSHENNRQWTFRDDRSSPVASRVTAPRDLPPRACDERWTGDPLRGGGVLGGVGNAPDATTGQDSQAKITATTGLEVLQEHGPNLVDQRLMAAVVSGVEPAAAPAAEPLEGVGADQVRSLSGRAALSAGTARGGAERGNQPMVDVAADQVRDAQPADSHIAEEGQLAARVPAAGDLLSGDLPVISDQAWGWMEPLLPSSTGRQGGRWRDHRQVVEAICWKYRTGSTWRELPARFGPWQTAYERVTRWSADGTWARLLARAQTDADGSGELDWLVAVDSSVVHQHRASARLVGGNAATASPDDPADGAAA
jgi:putative transposase